MTGPTLDSVPQGSLRPDGWPARRGAWAPTFRLALCAGIAAVLLACGGGSGGGSADSGGGGGGTGEPPLATEPVDLPPGQTVAQLVWEPSRGLVSSYMVFLSRNRGSFDFDQMVAEPAARIGGAPGDEIRITVIAVNPDGDLSDASPPSVPIRFHAAPAAPPVDDNAPVIPPAGGEPSPPAADPPSDPAPAPDDAPAASEPDPTTPPDTTPETPPETLPPDPTDEPSGLTATQRARLLLMDVRRPLAGWGDATAAWIQSRADLEVGPGVALIATAAREADAMDDLVWQDPAGQLWLSDGGQLAAAEDAGTTLVAAIPLLESERFVDLLDLDGDGIRDWLVEDTATGAAWFRPDEASPSLPARSPDLPESMRLLGSGDFDGDGNAELLWQDEDGSLALARPSGGAPAILSGAAPPPGSRIVAVADLTGDGRDDLIARGEDGLLALGLAAAGAGADGGIDFEWSEGHAEADASAELMATLDLDGDGRSELAWLVDGIVEIRGIGETTPRAFEL